MSCIPVPPIPVPTLPFPLTIAPPAPPTVEFDEELCCKLLQFVPPIPPIPLPPLTVNPAVAAIIMNNIQLVQTFLDSLPLDCPRE